MNIVRITSGLGNQIFQYALYRALKEQTPETFMDIDEFRYRKHHNGYELERIFAIRPQYATPKQIQQLADVRSDFFSDFRRKILHLNLKGSGELILESDWGTVFHPELLTKKNAYFRGFWQTEYYFRSIREILLNELTFKIPLDKRNAFTSDLINGSQSVSLHIRRGDYLKKRRYESFGTVCSNAYYQKSIEYIRSRVKNPVFFVFSDEMEWVKANFPLENAHFIDYNKGLDSYRDMQLMSLCKHQIIANSSFSWWAAWLNTNPDKMVLAPEVWFRSENMPDIVPESWIRIPIE